MKKITFFFAMMSLTTFGADRVTTANGTLEGTMSNGVRMFKGIQYGQPPVGDLRWKPPQPVENWSGVRQAAQFGPRCMQASIFGDMNFRSNGMSEDCLYLNVWTPAKSMKEKLPVLVYYYGGGFIAGDGSEPRYDGENMARSGIVALTVNYRLGAFGFFAHPELVEESPHHAAGNYGLLDQVAALEWVKKNIAAFGGDPNRITIAGESAGSVSVSALMTSPLSRDLIAGAIGESGSLFGTLSTIPLDKAEAAGVAFAKSIDAPSLSALRAIPGEKLLESSSKRQMGTFSVTVDGYLFPEPPLSIYLAGKEAKVPMLAGWNSEEMTYRMLFGMNEATPENYRKIVEKQFGNRASEILKLYPGDTKEQVIESATDLASDRFIAYSTWKWIDMQAKSGGKPVFAYLYARARPEMRKEMGDAAPGLAGGVVRGTQAKTAMAMPPAKGAVHSSEIEYAMGNLDTNKVYAWTPNDHQVSKTMHAYFANFIKKGDPNGPGVPKWPAINRGGMRQMMRIDVESKAIPEPHRARHVLLDEIAR